MPEFAITSENIIWFCTLVAGIWGLWKIVVELRKPSDDLKSVVQKHTDFLTEDHKRMEEYEESNRMILRCLLIIINHEITGNGIETMKEARDNLQNYLVDK